MIKQPKFLYYDHVLRWILWGSKNKLQQISAILPESLVIILKILQRYGIIDYFMDGTVTNNFCSVTVFLKYYRNQPILQEIKIFSKPSHLNFTSYSKLKKIITTPNTTPTIFLVSTPNGIVSNNEIIKNKNSGILLAKIN